MNEGTEYMSLEEVADMMGVTYQLIYRLVREGEIPAVRLGKLYRVSRRDLDGYLARNKNTNGGGICSVCGTRYRAADSLRNECTEDGCGEPICFDCWTRLGVRKCREHGGRAE
jgi:excisionase family DNA binding protein